MTKLASWRLFYCLRGNYTSRVRLQQLAHDMRVPNLHYDYPTEFAYRARATRRPSSRASCAATNVTVKDWLTGRTKVPWWVPEILRLKQFEAQTRNKPANRFLLRG